VNGRREPLWLALRFPDLPLAALAPDQASDSSSFPVIVAEKHQVIYANRLARKADVTAGMDITTAQLLSDCRILPRNITAERKTLDALCEQLYRFTPHIRVQTSKGTCHAGLLLEISTCLRLFGGAARLCSLVLDYLTALNHPVVWATGHTDQAAWLLTFGNTLATTEDVTGEETRETYTERLNQLPINVFTEFPQQVDALDKMGFATLGDIARQIRAQSVASFTKRLGADFAGTIQAIYDIDQGFNQPALFSKPVDTYVPDEVFREEVQFDYPLALVDHLKAPIETLLQQLAEFLRTRQLECQHIQWRLADIYHREQFLQVVSDTGQSDWPLFRDLTLIQLENTPLPFEVDSLELYCNDLMPRQARTANLDFTGEASMRGAAQELAITMAKLKNRVGDSAVRKVSYEDSPLPELSHAIVALADKCRQNLPDAHRQSLRPSWLFIKPQPVEERRQQLYWRGALTLAVGPERVVGQWWNEPVARDYYLAHRQDNVPVWAFQDLYTKEWFVHGVFA
jgi:protein ImuB